MMKKIFFLLLVCITFNSCKKEVTQNVIVESVSEKESDEIVQGEKMAECFYTETDSYFSIPWMQIIYSANDIVETNFDRYPRYEALKNIDKIKSVVYNYPDGYVRYTFENNLIIERYDTTSKPMDNEPLVKFYYDDYNRLSEIRYPFDEGDDYKEIYSYYKDNDGNLIRFQKDSTDYKIYSVLKESKKDDCYVLEEFLINEAERVLLTRSLAYYESKLSYEYKVYLNENNLICKIETRIPQVENCEYLYEYSKEGKLETETINKYKDGQLIDSSHIKAIYTDNFLTEIISVQKNSSGKEISSSVKYEKYDSYGNWCTVVRDGSEKETTRTISYEE